MIVEKFRFVAWQAPLILEFNGVIMCFTVGEKWQEQHAGIGSAGSLMNGIRPRPIKAK